MSAEDCGHCEDCAELKEIIKNIVKILSSSGTQLGGAHPHHEHHLFDDYDRQQLAKLIKSLS